MGSVISSNLAVKNGQLIHMYNSLRPSFSNEAKSYYALWVKDPSDNSEFCLLFTESELGLMKVTITSNNDQFKLGYIYSETVGKRTMYTLKYSDLDKQEKLVTLSVKLFNKALQRAKKNIEDNPKKSWFVDKVSEEFI